MTDKVSKTAKTTKPRAATATKKTAAKSSKPKAAAKPKATKAAPKKGQVTEMSKQESMKVKADEFRTRATERARTAAEEGKARTGDALHNLSKFIEESAVTIDQNAGAKYGDYVRSAADAVANFGDKVDEKEVDEIVEDAREMVRKSPAIAVGAAAALGFVIARMLKSGGKDA